MRRNDGTTTVLYVVYIVVSVIAFWGLLQLLAYVSQVANSLYVTESYVWFFAALALFGLWLAFEQIFAAKAAMAARLAARLLIVLFCLPNVHLASYSFMNTYIYSKIPGGAALQSQWFIAVMLLIGGYCLGQLAIDIARFATGGNYNRDIFDR